MVRPLAANELSVPPEQCPRSHDERPPPIAREDPARRREQHLVAGAEPRAANSPREHLYLMSQNQQLDVPLQVTPS